MNHEEIYSTDNTWRFCEHGKLCTTNRPYIDGAVVAQSELLKKIFSAREKTQNKIIAAETAVTAAMERMHKVENQMLDYLSNVQGDAEFISGKTGNGTDNCRDTKEYVTS